jgi:hypothetical protein
MACSHQNQEQSNGLVRGIQLELTTIFSFVLLVLVVVFFLEFVSFYFLPIISPLFPRGLFFEVY